MVNILKKLPVFQTTLPFISFCFFFAKVINFDLLCILSNSGKVIGVVLSTLFKGLHAFVFPLEAPQSTFEPVLKYGST